MESTTGSNVYYGGHPWAIRPDGHRVVNGIFPPPSASMVIAHVERKLINSDGRKLACDSLHYSNLSHACGSRNIREAKSSKTRRPAATHAAMAPRGRNYEMTVI